MVGIDRHHPTPPSVVIPQLLWVVMAGTGPPWEKPRPPASALSIAVVVEGDAFHWSVGELSLWRVAIRLSQCEQNLAWAQAMHGDLVGVFEGVDRAPFCISKKFNC
jgi:hypothetical protein